VRRVEGDGVGVGGVGVGGWFPIGVGIIGALLVTDISVTIFGLIGVCLWEVVFFYL
jgi:hypothetical protein